MAQISSNFPRSAAELHFYTCSYSAVPLRNCGIPHFYIYFIYSAIPGSAAELWNYAGIPRFHILYYFTYYAIPCSAFRCGTAELRRNSAIPYFVVLYLFCNSGFRVPLRNCGNPPEFRDAVFCITLLILQFRVPRSAA